MLEYISEDNLNKVVQYPNGGESRFYVKEDTAVIIDDGICNCPNPETVFSYSMITDVQNHYMRLFRRVYRFLKEDIGHLSDYEDWGREQSDEIDFSRRTADRENSADASPLEFHFEQSFSNVFGQSGLKYLRKEYGIVDRQGHNYFLDYYIRTRNGGIAVEENGIHFHHPQIIGKKRYRYQLQKQNACTAWGIKLFRFSTEDCVFAGRIEDDIRSFFGEDTSQFQEDSVLASRNVSLYEHQSESLDEMEQRRREGIKACLIVLPTASGKSRIVEEDIRRFANDHPGFRALILAPNVNIIKDWNARIADSLEEFQERIDVWTYAYMVRHYTDISPDQYSYIVVDEAHHAVAPMLKRVIQHFTPEFMVGLTATDQRPDKKKLESVFGTYSARLSLIEAMEKDIVARANVYRIETNLDLSHVRFNGKDYINADLEKTIRVNSRNELIVQVLKEYFCEGAAGERQGVIFCVNVGHTKEMERLLNQSGIRAASYTGASRNADQIMKDFKEKKIRFLCACEMISEGWDYPELGILVMARPTLSKVLYLQQIGRGLRRTPNKSNVFIIDVVDEYGAMAIPCSMHSIFKNPVYAPFGDISRRNHAPGELIEVDGFSERIERVTEIDINSFEDKYGNYLSQEQLAREFFVSTGTVTSWIKKGKIRPTVSYPFGAKLIHLFSPEDLEKIRNELQIPVHDESTIKADFFDFLEERDYSLSYKMPFMLSFLKHMDSIGDAKIEDVLKDYIGYYKKRISSGYSVDRATCPYNTENLNDSKFVKRSMLTNPFEKFERKRFLYYSKDLGVISFNHDLFFQMEQSDIQRVKAQLAADLKNYYRDMGEVEFE